MALNADAQPTQEFQEVDGLRLSCLRWPSVDGAADARDVLFLLHGFLDLAWGMAPFVRALREAGVGAQLIAPDWRGHGDSGWIGAGGYYHFPDYIGDLDALTVRYAPPDGGRLLLFGHSMGGGAGSLFAAAFPERVHAFVNAEGYGPPGGAWHEGAMRLRRFAESLRNLRAKRTDDGGRGMASLEEAAGRLKLVNPTLPDEVVAEIVSKATRRSADGTYRWKFDPLHRTPSPYPFNADAAMLIWREITCPTLLIEGADSPMRALPDLQARRDAFVHGTLEVIDGAGHMMHQEKPDALAARVARFFQTAAR